MQVEIVKRPDGAGVLRCTRADGSVSWQKQTDRHAAFFALHDLTHFAVETTLGYMRGFFSLVAEGWDIDDTTGKGARGPLPAEAIEVEILVGLFSMEASSGLCNADHFNATLARQLEASGSYSPRLLGGEQLIAVRKRRSELFQQWADIPVGETMQLTF
jgi:hypothetical protein